jgi:hypothetical protein
VQWSKKAISALRKSGIPVLAFLTPTNHLLLHDFIDNTSYEQNGRFLRDTFERSGATVVDLDQRFPARVFIDNDHLRLSGQRMLADVLQRPILVESRR